MVASTFTFRRLVRDDVEPLKQLLGVFAEAFEDAETYGGAVPSDDYLATLLGKPHFVVVAAFLEATVVGGLAAYVLDKFEQDRREIYVYDLAVAKPHRRKGLATGAIGELRRIAADLDVYVIFVQADLEDAPAIALYESLGHKETAHHFDIEVRCSR